MLPNSVRSWVLMYFLSGQISRYAPMLTSCLPPSVSTRPVLSPLTYSAVPSTHTGASRHTRPWGAFNTAVVPRGGLVSSAGYPPAHRFSIS